MSLDGLNFRRVETLDDALDFREWLGRRREWMGADVETSGLNFGHDRIRLMQFGDGEVGWTLDWPEWKGLAAEVIRGYAGRVVWHNSLYDATMLELEGVHVPRRWMHDTLAMCFLKDPSARMDLKGACAVYVDERARVGQQQLRSFMAAGRFGWGDVPRDAEAYWLYSAFDTCLTALLAERLWADTGGGPLREAYELNMAVIGVLAQAQGAGILVDEDYRLRCERQLEYELASLEAEIPFRPASDNEAREHLIAIGARIHERTPKGQVSVDKHVLRRLFREDPDRFAVCRLLDQYRQKSRTLGTYIRNFANVEDGGLAVDHVLRCHAHPVGGLDDETGKGRGTRTGRLSITEPALQTLPRGRIVRDAVVARDGCRILQADYKGMELRALASLAGEAAMLDAFARGEDLHDFVARQVYGDGFTKPQRGTAKNASFAKAYCAGVAQFAATAGIPEDEAQAFMDRYDEMFPGVAAYQQRVIGEIMAEAGSRRGRGWVELPDGTRLPVEGGEAYKGVNYKIQGGTAVAAKRKLVELDAAGMGDFFRLAVHDEFLFEVPEDDVEEARETIARVMPDPRTYPGVVLEIDQDEVHRWGEHYRGPDYPAYVETEPAPWLADAA